MKTTKKRSEERERERERERARERVGNAPPRGNKHRKGGQETIGQGEIKQDEEQTEAHTTLTNPLNTKQTKNGEGQQVQTTTVEMEQRSMRRRDSGNGHTHTAISRDVRGEGDRSSHAPEERGRNRSR